MLQYRHAERGLMRFAASGGRPRAAFVALVGGALLLQPVAVACLAWWLLHEPLGPWQMTGGLVVLAGILIARRGSLTVDHR